jgi:hypothetical protein
VDLGGQQKAVAPALFTLLAQFELLDLDCFVC